jgi:hypothetical protein
MGITGSLTDVSLSEIFQLFERSKRTGLLTVEVVSGPSAPLAYNIWVERGRIVAAANSPELGGLVSLIRQCQRISDRTFDKLLDWCCPLDDPLGLCLRQHSIISASQLEQIFQIQLLQQICPLLQLNEAQFKFTPKVVSPGRELTGLSIPATEAILMGLRVLQSQERLVERLPDPNRGLIGRFAGQPYYQFDTLEWQVWQYTKGADSLQAIAQQLKLPLDQVQEIAFRMIAIGLAQDVPPLVSA